MPFTDRNGVRHALGVSRLPLSVEISAVRVDSWTDYIFNADITVDPSDMDYLLSGRDFKKQDDKGEIPEYYIDNYEAFDHDSRYVWGDYSKLGVSCSLYVNRTEGRIFIDYGAD